MNKIPKYLLTFFLTLAAVCVLLLLVVPVAEYSLETMIQKRIRQTAAGFKVRVNQFQLENIGFYGAHFRDVEIGETGEKKINIPEIYISYTPGGIRRGEISRVRIVGLTVYGEISSGGEIQINGLPPLSVFMKEKKGNVKTGTPLPPMPDIFLDNAFLFLKTPLGSLLIPGNVECRFRENVCHARARFFPEGGTIEGNGDISLPAIDGTVKLSWNRIAAGHWLQQVLKKDSLFLAGTVSGKAAVTVKGGHISSASADVRTENSALRFQDVSMALDARGHMLLTGSVPEQITLSVTVSSLVSDQLKLAAPATIRLEGNALNTLKVSAEEIRFLKPAPFALSFSGDVSGIPAMPEINGVYSLCFPAEATASISPDLPANAVPVKMKGKFSAQLEKEIPLFSFSGRLNQPMVILLSDGGKVKTAFVTAGVKVSGSPGTARFSSEVQLKNLSAKIGKSIVRGKEIRIRAGGDFGLSGMRLKRVKAVFSNFSLDDGDGNRITGFSGKGHYASGSVGNGGEISIADVVTPDISFSNIRGRIQQVKTGFSFAGNGNLPVKQLKLSFNGVFNLENPAEMLSVDFHLPKTVLSEGTDLSPIVSALSGFAATGTVEMSGKISMKKDASPVSTATLNIQNMNLSTEDGSVNVNGINAVISFSDLMNMVSLSDQLATVECVAAGPARFEEGKIRFQLLDSDTVLLQSVGFSFAKGNLSVSSFLLSAVTPNIDIGIYCNRLELTSLLNLAMGEGKAEGEGTVSGYIPLQIKNGSLVFGKGFLQSVPGRPGTIRIADSKDITGGVVLAEEAVKDFSYQWARVNLESQNGNLNLILKLDGKPNRKLPLIYDEKSGEFVKDPLNRPLVSLQGLSLDLKFVDIDINRLLKQQGKVKFTSK